MGAPRLNYVVCYTNESQVYGAATKQVAQETPLPEGVSIEDKTILFIAFDPENQELVVRKLPKEEILKTKAKVE